MHNRPALVLQPGPVLKLKTNGEAERIVTCAAAEHLSTPIYLENVRLADVVKLLQLNPGLLNAMGREHAIYVQKCLAASEVPVSPNRSRFTPYPKCVLVLSSTLGFDPVTREVDTEYSMHLHAEYPAEDYVMATHSLLGIHIQDALQMSVRYESTVELLETDYGRLKYEHCIGTINRAMPTLAELCAGIFQEFSYRDEPVAEYAAQGGPRVVALPRRGEANRDIKRLFAEPLPAAELHRSLLNAVYFYIKDDVNLEAGLSNTHPDAEFELQGQFKLMTGYETRRVLLGPDNA